MTIHAPDPAQGNLLISERERFDHESQVGEKADVLARQIAPWAMVKILNSGGSSFR